VGGHNGPGLRAWPTGCADPGVPWGGEALLSGATDSVPDAFAPSLAARTSAIPLVVPIAPGASALRASQRILGSYDPIMPT